MIFFNQLLGLTKQMLIAYKLGSGAETDAYFTAIIATILLANIIGEAISLGTEPILSKIENKKGKEHKLNYVNNLLHIVILLAIGILVLHWLLSPIIIKILVRGIEGKNLQDMLKLVRVGLPMGLFILIRAIFIAFLHSEDSPKSEFKSCLFYYAAYILFLTYFSHHGIHGLIITGIVASILQLCSIIPTAVAKGYRYKAILNFQSIYLREFFIALWPVVLGTSINMINVAVDKSFASTLITGSKSWLNYSDVIIHVAIGILVMGMIIIVIPALGKRFAGNDITSLKSLMDKGMHMVTSVVLPAMIVIITLANPIVKLLFERGKFAPADTLITSQVLIHYALGLVGIAIMLILINCHYAIHDPITSTKFVTLGVIINFILNWILINPMAVHGLALATSLSNTLVAALLIWNINKDTHIVDMKKVGKGLLRLFPILVTMAIVLLLTYNILNLIPWENTIMDMFQLLISIIAGIFIYSKLALKNENKLLKVHEKGEA
ncbi:MAG: murein biosynthesis integral membrane protein MurJ [Tissierellia bacterium]|nr:murein biosynthesis integral membrane protein MurJ [Tissierellia bacterium]